MLITKNLLPLCFLLLAPLHGGCTIMERVDTLVQDIKGMRYQLNTLNETNYHIQTMSSKLDGLQEMNSNITSLNGTTGSELRAVRESMDRLDENMSKLLKLFEENQ